MSGAHDDPDVDARLAAITRDAREGRPRTSRTVWWLAALVGLASAIAFVVVLVADPAPSATTPPAQARDARGGFTTGLVLGLGVGIAIGYVIARQAARHSSRNSP